MTTMMLQGHGPLACTALPTLLLTSVEHGRPQLHTWAVGTFAVTMMLVYLASALCHGLPPGRGKQVAGKLDEAAIYLFIAGSYTPFAASGLHDPSAWLLLGIVWALALLGIAATLSHKLTHRGWSTGLYLLMGWFVLISALPWIAKVSADGIGLLIAGGLTYSVGALLFLLSRRLRFAHLAWHLMVMTGSSLHFAAVLWHS